MGENNKHLFRTKKLDFRISLLVAKKLPNRSEMLIIKMVFMSTTTRRTNQKAALSGRAACRQDAGTQVLVGDAPNYSLSGRRF